MTINYDLQVTVGGYLSAPLESIVSGVSAAIGLYPGYTYQRTEIIGDVIHIFYSDDYADPSTAQAEIAPVIVYAILAVLALLSILVISYLLVVVAPKSMGGSIIIYSIGVLAVAYLISKVRK